jgi:hypothetical protein
VNNAVRQPPPQAAPSSSRRPTHASPATVIQLSASPGRKADPAAPAGAEAAPARRRSRGSDLVFGGVLAVILLIACLTWEVLRDGEPSHAALDGARHGVTPAAVR